MKIAQKYSHLNGEILPTKLMQSEMSSGVAYYEGEVYHVLDMVEIIRLFHC